jgi:hypothetical protein
VWRAGTGDGAATSFVDQLTFSERFSANPRTQRELINKTRRWSAAAGGQAGRQAGMRRDSRNAERPRGRGGSGFVERAGAELVLQ